ncbi:MAG: exodeoxyribonuclease VII large subunit [Candidatus Moranbacteria bacterium]|nr:exodeoxyribonuclease VII large subunit [Candidatus Moranbacteria bacterium]
MNQKLLYRLRAWRVTQAQKEGVELFRVLPNVTLQEIARVVPKTAAEFLKIKGIKEGRWKKYGAMLLAIMADSVPAAEDTDAVPTPRSTMKLDFARMDAIAMESMSVFDEAKSVDAALAEQDTGPEIPGQRTLYTVSAFLDALNVLFAEMTVRVQGEISSVDTRDKTTYFTLKDSQDGSILSCLIFRYQYDVSGVKLSVGQEVIVEGVPGIWKPTGRLSLKAQSIEVSGVGALQKAYDELKQKLEKEGLFAPERKQALPIFPERIALITSNQGAAIGDFMMNLGKYGFKISLLNASVEGKKAVLDLIAAVRFFNRHPKKYDVLVIIRGGGSLESLQAFNNEALVREVAASAIPTLCGIGHEKDVSLVALSGDVMVSTPTATARALRESFERADALLIRQEQRLMSGFGSMLQAARKRCEDGSSVLLHRLQLVKDGSMRVQNAFARSVEKWQFSMLHTRSVISQLQKTIVDTYTLRLESVQERMRQNEMKLAANDPTRLLKLGYSLIAKQGKIVRNIGDVSVGDMIDIQLADGSIGAEVRKA